MKTSPLKIYVLIVLGALPFMVAYAYISEQLPYRNSPHLSTLWNKNEAKLFVEENAPLRQKFKVSGAGLDRIDVRLAKGDGQYKWSIKKDPLSKESIATGTFKGSDVQNYGFISLKPAGPLDDYMERELWLIIERTDQGKTPGIAVFNTVDNEKAGPLAALESAGDYKSTGSRTTDHPETVVFQLYYRRN